MFLLHTRILLDHRFDLLNFIAAPVIGFEGKLRQRNLQLCTEERERQIDEIYKT